MPLALVLAKSCTTTNDLFKLSHGIDFLVYDYQATSLAIHTSRKKFGCGYYHWVWLVNTDKVVELFFAFLVLANDSCYIVWRFFAHIRIHAYQQGTHFSSFLYVWAKHNGLSHTSNIFQHLGDAMGYHFSA